MPSIFSHSLVGATGGFLLNPKEKKIRFWTLSILCPILPDLDVLTFKLGIPYGHFLGHRGFFHSLFFAALLGCLLTLLFFGLNRKDVWKRLGLALYFSALIASHGVLDAFTSGGLGIALLSPFDETRYFSPWTPITVSPLGIRRFFSEWGVRVILSELKWVGSPLLLISALTLSIRAVSSRIRSRQE